jgi:hypothetical protein
VLILLDVYPLRRLAGGWRRWTSREARSIWAEKIPFVILAAVGAGMAMYAGRSVADSLHARPLSGHALEFRFRRKLDVQWRIFCFDNDLLIGDRNYVARDQRSFDAFGLRGNCENTDE